MSRILIAICALVLGVVVATFVPTLPDKVRGLVSPPRSASGDGRGERDEHGHAHGAGEAHGAEGVVALSEEQVKAADIGLAPVSGGSLSQELAVPGTIVANANALGHVPANVAGTLKEIRKQLGDSVARGEVLAVVESRGIAEAKSEYLTAQRSVQLAQTTLRREKSLWDQRVSAEQDYIQARATAEEAAIRLEAARQKLTAIGLDLAQINALPQRAAGALRFHDVRAPLAGRVIVRAAELGSSVEPGTALFTIADLSTVWVELSVSPADLPRVREGAKVTVKTAGRTAEARLIFVSPLVNNETRTARAVAQLPNADGSWRPGDYAQAELETGSQPVDVLVPRSAIQVLGAENVVFVRTAEGFEKREIVLGGGNEQAVEVVFGLDPGETIAVTNSFVLKAELGKAEAEHTH